MECSPVLRNMPGIDGMLSLITNSSYAHASDVTMCSGSHGVYGVRSHLSVLIVCKQGDLQKGLNWLGSLGNNVFVRQS